MKKTAALFISSLCVLYSCKQKKETILPEVNSITQSVYASGTIKSRNQYQVFASTTGTIEKVFVTEGDVVKKGQVLFQIYNPTVKINKDNSLVAATYNSLQNNEDKLQELKNAIEVARQKNSTDSLLYNRQLNLWQQNIGTRVDLEQKQLNALNSKKNYESARLKYEQLKKQLDFLAKQSGTNLSLTSALAGDLQVKSELNGKVLTIFKKKGELATPQTPVAIVGDSNNFYIELHVDEYDITKVKEGQTALITMDSYKGRVFEALVNKIYPIMNERSKSFIVEAYFTKPPEKVYSNLTVEANIVTLTKNVALLIPRNYLVDEQFVILKNGDKRQVQTGLKDYQKVEIVSGITKGDILVKPQ